MSIGSWIGWSEKLDKFSKSSAFNCHDDSIQSSLTARLVARSHKTVLTHLSLDLCEKHFHRLCLPTKLPSRLLAALFKETITEDFDSSTSKVLNVRTKVLSKQIKEFTIPGMPFRRRYHRLRRRRLPLCCVAFSLVPCKYKWYKYFGMPSGWMKRHQQTCWRVYVNGAFLEKLLFFLIIKKNSQCLKISIFVHFFH